MTKTGPSEPGTTGRNEAGRNEAGRNETGRNETGRNETGGNETGGRSLEPGPAPEPELLGIGAAAALLGISERSLRYYQQLGLVTPCARTPGGMRRYSGEDLTRVARIRELQSLLGLNLEEIAVVLRTEDRAAEIKQSYHDERTGAARRTELLREALSLQEDLRATVEAKRVALEKFLADVDARIKRIRALLSNAGPDE